MSEDNTLYEYIITVYEEQYKVIGTITEATSEGLVIYCEGTLVFVTTERYTVNNLKRWKE